MINPVHNTIYDGAVDCDCFLASVLPLRPELNMSVWHELLREEDQVGEGWKECARCHKPFIPCSNRQQYCSACGATVSRASNRERQRRFRENRKAAVSVTL